MRTINLHVHIVESRPKAISTTMSRPYIPVDKIVHPKYMFYHTDGGLAYVQYVLEGGDIFIT